jgi:CubicO group peptidase (beta-lactamase class C family)
MVFIAAACFLAANAGVPVLAGSSHQHQRADACVRGPVSELRADAAYPAVSVAVAKSGDRVSTWVDGQADVKDERPADDGDIYQVGSVTKSFIGVLLGVLVESGELELDQPLSTAWPETAGLPKGYDPTLEEIATHTAGLPRYPANLERVDGDPILGFSDEQLLLGLKLAAESGGQIGEFDYSNVG